MRKRYLRLLTILILISALITPLVAPPFVGTASAAVPWLGDYKWRQLVTIENTSTVALVDHVIPITIINSSDPSGGGEDSGVADGIEYNSTGWTVDGNLYNFRVEIELTSGANLDTGIAAPFTVDTWFLTTYGYGVGNTYATSNGGEIRFSQLDQTTISAGQCNNFWFDPTSYLTQEAYFWVVDDGAGWPIGITTIYMFIDGDVTAPVGTMAADGDATFQFFDDFNVAGPDGAKWFTNGTPIVSGNGVAVLDGAADILRGKTGFPYSAVVGAQVNTRAIATERDNLFAGMVDNLDITSWHGGSNWVGTENIDVLTGASLTTMTGMSGKAGGGPSDNTNITVENFTTAYHYYSVGRGPSTAAVKAWGGQDWGFDWFYGGTPETPIVDLYPEVSAFTFTVASTLTVDWIMGLYYTDKITSVTAPDFDIPEAEPGAVTVYTLNHSERWPYDFGFALDDAIPTELDAWLDPVTGAGTLVEYHIGGQEGDMPVIPASSSIDIYVYWGSRYSSGAGLANDKGSNIFEFFDDFDDKDAWEVAAGSWDSTIVGLPVYKYDTLWARQPIVKKVGSIYYMTYAHGMWDSVNPAWPMAPVRGGLATADSPEGPFVFDSVNWISSEGWIDQTLGNAPQDVYYDTASSVYYMLYLGNGWNNGSGIATSPDLVNWTPYASNPVINPPYGMGVSLDKFEDTWYIIYSSQYQQPSGASVSPNKAFWYYYTNEATPLTTNWTFGGEVLDPDYITDCGYREDSAVHYVVATDTWYLFYSASLQLSACTTNPYIGYATISGRNFPGGTWTEHGAVNMPTSAWNSALQGSPGIYEESGIYYMYYYGLTGSGAQTQDNYIGVVSATSLDGPWTSVGSESVYSQTFETGIARSNTSVGGYTAFEYAAQFTYYGTGYPYVAGLLFNYLDPLNTYEVGLQSNAASDSGIYAYTLFGGATVHWDPWSYSTENYLIPGETYRLRVRAYPEEANTRYWLSYSQDGESWITDYASVLEPFASGSKLGLWSYLSQASFDNARVSPFIYPTLTYTYGITQEAPIPAVTTWGSQSFGDDEYQMTIMGNVTDVDTTDVEATFVNYGFRWAKDPFSLTVESATNDWNKETDGGGGTPFGPGVPINYYIDLGNGTGPPMGTALERGTLYYYTAYAVNVATVYGNITTFLTEPDEPTITAIGTPVEVTGDLEITLTWNAADSAQSTYVRRKNGGYPAGAGDPTTWDGTQVGYLPTTGSPSMYIDTSGLVGGTTYYYTAWSYVSAGGHTEWSAPQQLGFDLAMAAVTVTTQAADYVFEERAQLHGNITDLGGSPNASEVGFDYTTYAGVNPPTAYLSSATWTSGAPYAAAPFAGNVTIFDPGTTYFFRAKANTGIWGYDATPEDFLTKPWNPQNVNVTASGDSQISVSWTIGEGSTHTYLRYLVGSEPNDNRGDGTLVSGSPFSVSGVNSTSVTITGLTNGNDVYVKAWSYTVGDLSDTEYSDPPSSATTDWDHVVVVGGAIVLTDPNPSHTSSNYGTTHSGTDTTSATLWGYVTNTGGADVTIQGFRWDDNGAPWAQTGNWTETTTGTFGTGPIPASGLGYLRSSLTEGTLYAYQSVAYNGSWTTAEWVPFMTRPVSPTITTLCEVRETDIYLQWIKGIGATNTYIWRGSTGYPTGVPGSITSPMTGTLVYTSTTNSFEDITVVAGETYWYRLYSYVGNSPYNVEHYSIGSATYTAAFQQSPTVQTIRGSSTSSSTATLEGYLTYESGEYPSGVQVYFEYGTTTAYGSETVPSQNLTSSAAFTNNIVGLSPQVTYHFRAVAYWCPTEPECNSYGIDIAFTTMSEALLPPTLYVISRTSDSITLGWTHSSGSAEGILLKYNVGDSAGYPTAPADSSLSLGEFPLGVNTYVHENLLEGQTYWYAAWAYSGIPREYSAERFPLMVVPESGGLGDPEVIQIEDVVVFEDYMETGSQLFVISYKLIYEGNEDPYQLSEDYYDFQILEGDIVRAQTPVPFWGYRPASFLFVFNANLVWGTPYTLKLTGKSSMFIEPPETPNHVIDWREGDLSQLDTWVLLLASRIESYYQGLGSIVTLVDYAPTQQVLSETGAQIFNKGIPGFCMERPDVCAYSASPVSPDEGLTPVIDRYSGNVTGSFGSRITDGLTALGGHLNMSGTQAGGFIWLGVFVLVVGGGIALTQSPVMGLILALPLLGIGNYLGGVVPFAITGIIGLLCILWLAKKVWIQEA